MNAASLGLIDPHRAAFRAHLEALGLTSNALADRIGIGRAELYYALRGSVTDFKAARYRMRVERELQQLFWTDPQEAKELGEIGKALGVDMLTTTVNKVLRAARKAGVQYQGQPTGFGVFAAALAKFFPQTPTLKLTHYANATRNR